MVLLWISIFALLVSVGGVVFIHETFPESCTSLNVKSGDVSVSGQYHRGQEWCDGQPVYQMEDVFLYHSEGLWRLGPSPCLAWNARLRGDLRILMWTNAEGKTVSTSVECDTRTPISVEWTRTWVTCEDCGAQRGPWVLRGSSTDMGIGPRDSLRDSSIASEVSLQGHHSSNPIIVHFRAQLSSTAVAQLKMFPKHTNLKQLTSRSEYLLLFGPRVRTSGTRIEASLDLYISLPGGKALVRSEKLSSSVIRSDGQSHFYHLIIQPDKTFIAGVDGVNVMRGKVQPHEMENERSREISKHGHSLVSGQGHFTFVGQVGAIGFASYSRNADLLVDDVIITDDVQMALEHQEMKDGDEHSKPPPKKHNADELLAQMKKARQQDDETRAKIPSDKWEQKRRMELQAKQLEMEATLIRLTEQALNQLNQAKAVAADFTVHQWDHAVIALATVCQTAVILVLLFKLSVNGNPTVILREEVPPLKNGHKHEKGKHGDRNNNNSEHTQKVEAIRRRNAFVRRSMSCDMTSGIQ
ncbi:hypothetical protein CAPTEDRAFT_201527 [Capitella teleta]|uniref:Farnesoic acid O-methyl transferase domain-containing protein n=1 Tax=Capitella teleta TaxID=283909 RepID=R7UUK8_CAPTE|nr:hypothetical protein CAPTEDRAFT_201527 [Capitella teleta]|eukprot:ELU07592.1 hypothetical protein CAPTEDRAFT_201527 [Capitella teleta]